MERQLTKQQLLKIYLWTLSYFKPYLILTGVYFISGGLMLWGELMIPRRMGYIIDNILPRNDVSLLYDQILNLCIIVVLILVSKSIFRYLEKTISVRITKDQQTDLMIKLQSLGYSYSEKVPTGNILAMFENSVKETQKTYTFLFPNLGYSLGQFLVPSVILLINAPMFFFAAMVGNLIYIFLNRYANNRIHHYLGIETSKAQKSQQLLYDALVATKELKNMGREDWFREKTIEAFDEYRKPRMMSIFWRHFRYTTVGLTLTISLILFYIFGFEAIKAGELLLGEFVAYSFMMRLISRGFSVFFYIIPAQYHALNYAKDLYDFIHLEEDVKSCGDIRATSNDITFDRVSFSYNETRVLEDVSFIIPAGKRTAIVGESGSGKSTILKLIGRFYDVNEGQVSIGHHSIESLEINSLRAQLGFVFQDTYLFNMSVRDNIRFGKPDASEEEIVAASKLASAHDFISSMSEGYNTLLGERGVRLSGGQKQRIAIARMLLKAPEIVLLDEATSALDNLTEMYIKETLNKISRDKTVVAVAHRLSTIIDYDKIIVLDNGRIVEEGDYDTLMNKRGKFHNLIMKGSEYAS